MRYAALTVNVESSLQIGYVQFSQCFSSNFSRFVFCWIFCIWFVWNLWHFSVPAMTFGDRLKHI